MEVGLKGRQKRGMPEAVKILSRIVSVAKDGLDYEADQRHAEIIANELGSSEESEGVATPGVSTSEERKERNVEQGMVINLRPCVA